MINPSIEPQVIKSTPASTLSPTSKPTDQVQSIATDSQAFATQTLTPIPTTSPVPLTMCSPLKDETISSLGEIVSNLFDPPPPGKDDHHHGVDFAHYRRGEQLTIEGEAVQAILPGVVAASIVDRLPYGNMVIIETLPSMIPESVLDRFTIPSGQSLYSLYAHMGLPPEVSLGDKVRCGQLLGFVGKTGYDIVNAHLHLETRIGPSGASFTSMAFYDTSATVEEMENYRRWRTSGEFLTLDPMGVFDAYLAGGGGETYTPIPYLP